MLAAVDGYGYELEVVEQALLPEDLRDDVIEVDLESEIVEVFRLLARASSPSRPSGR